MKKSRENVKKTRESTCTKKFGVENCFQLTDKIKETIVKEYGVDNIAKLDKTKEKIKTTVIQKYGTEYVLQLGRVRAAKKTNTAFGSEHFKEAMKRKYGVDHVHKIEKYKKKILSTNRTNLLDKMYDTCKQNSLELIKYSLVDDITFKNCHT